MIPLKGWEDTANMMEKWVVLLEVILRPPEYHSMVYDLIALI